MAKLSSGKRDALLFAALLLLAVLIFQKNLLHFAGDAFFANFQRDSESLVVGRIIADEFGLDRRQANIGRTANADLTVQPENLFDAYPVLSAETESANTAFIPYRSNYGIQGVFFSGLHRLLDGENLLGLQWINSALLALVTVLLFFVYRRIYDGLFATIFLVTLLSSPWIIAIARNLYWMSFLWFVPALLAALLYRQQHPPLRWLLLAGIALAVFLKSLAGYEYLSAITLLACSVFFVAPFFRKDDAPPAIDWAMAAWVFLACVAGFAAALLVHAGMRGGDSLLAGLQSIYELDVRRRTYGDPNLFDPAYAASLESSPLLVLGIYVIRWSTALMLWLPGRLFPLLMLLALGGVLFQFWQRHPDRYRNGMVLSVFFLVCVSWLLLAKGHSHIHTHINYVLWYFGFVQALLYVGLRSAVAFAAAFSARIGRRKIQTLKVNHE